MENRRFKFVGDKYESMGYGKTNPTENNIYDQDVIFAGRPVIYWAKDIDSPFQDEWKEVFERDVKGVDQIKNSMSLNEWIKTIKSYANELGMEVEIIFRDKK